MEVVDAVAGVVEEEAVEAEAEVSTSSMINYNDAINSQCDTGGCGGGGGC